MVAFVMFKSISKLITNPLKMPLSNYYTQVCLFRFPFQKLAR